MRPASCSETMSVTLDYFRAHLGRKGKKLTREAGVILGAALSKEKPFLVDDIVTLMSSHDLLDLFSASHDSVHRTLDELEDCGLLTRQSRAHGCDEYLPCLTLIRELETPAPPAFRGAFAASCAHESLIAEWCPWCGRPVIGGEVQAYFDPPHAINQDSKE